MNYEDISAIKYHIDMIWSIFYFMKESKYKWKYMLDMYYKYFYNNFPRTPEELKCAAESYIKVMSSYLKKNNTIHPIDEFVSGMTSLEIILLISEIFWAHLYFIWIESKEKIWYIFSKYCKFFIYNKYKWWMHLYIQIDNIINGLAFTSVNAI